MKLENLLRKQLEREIEHLSELEVGSEEYCKCMDRLNIVEDKLADLDKFEDNRKDRIIKNILDGAKTVGGFVLPIIGLVCITAVEKEITFTGALRDYTKLFIPRR